MQAFRLKMPWTRSLPSIFYSERDSAPWITMPGMPKRMPKRMPKPRPARAPPSPPGGRMKDDRGHGLETKGRAHDRGHGLETNRKRRVRVKYSRSERRHLRRGESSPSPLLRRREQGHRGQGPSRSASASAEEHDRGQGRSRAASTSAVEQDESSNAAPAKEQLNRGRGSQPRLHVRSPSRREQGYQRPRLEPRSRSHSLLRRRREQEQHDPLNICDDRGHGPGRSATRSFEERDRGHRRSRAAPSSAGEECQDSEADYDNSPSRSQRSRSGGALRDRIDAEVEERARSGDSRHGGESGDKEVVNYSNIMN